jgi:phosphate transport system permease protein
MKLKERLFKTLLFVISLVSIISVIFIFLFVFKQGSEPIFRFGLRNILSLNWRPLEGQFGQAPMLIATIIVTFFSVSIATPLGLIVAIFLAEISPKRIRFLINATIQLLAGIPSVIYGFFGLCIIVPLIQRIFHTSGLCILSAGLILAVMILPTIISISYEAISKVPIEYKEASLALGASIWQTLFKILLPQAKSGILASIILSLGRAAGETIAVLMLLGNTPIIPKSLLSPARSLTANIALEIQYADALHQKALFTSGCFLFIIVISLVVIFNFFYRKKEYER